MYNIIKDKNVNHNEQLASNYFQQENIGEITLIYQLDNNILNQNVNKNQSHQQQPYITMPFSLNESDTIKKIKLKKYKFNLKDPYQFLFKEENTIKKQNLKIFKQKSKTITLLLLKEEITIKKKIFKKQLNHNVFNEKKSNKFNSVSCNLSNNYINLKQKVKNESIIINSQTSISTGDTLDDAIIEDQVIKDSLYHIKINKKFYMFKDKIYEELNKKNYFITDYLNSGGQANIFDGYYINDQGIKDSCVFKIYYGIEDEDFFKEIEIMKSFEENINIVQIIDSIPLKIQQIFILVLEKCQYSLQKELDEFIQRKEKFTNNKLLQMIFDLVDGLIQFRIYNILHLDIKPGNILITKEGNYCYSDFGNSHIKEEDKNIEAKFYTEKYVSPEQLNKNNPLDFKSDVYSLGITMLKIIEVFRFVNKQYLQNKKNQRFKIIIKGFKKIIKKNMINDEIKQRSECKYLHQLFFQCLQAEDQQQFYQIYKTKLKKLDQIYPYYQNKDTDYLLELKLFYNLTYLKLLKNIQNVKQNEDQIDNQQYLSEIDQYLIDVFDFQISQQKNQDIATTLQNIGNCYKMLEFGDKYMKYTFESLVIRKHIFKGNNIEISQSQNNMGLCLVKSGFLEEGLKYFLESLDMIKQFFIENNPQIASILINIGEVYNKLGDFKNALKYSLESLYIRKQIFKGYHSDIARSLNFVGYCYQKLCDFQKGLKYQIQSLEMRKQIFKENSQMIDSSKNNMKLYYEDIISSSQLRQYRMKYSLESQIMKNLIFQGNHPQIVLSLQFVGLCYFEFGDYLNSLKYQLESLEMQQKIFNESCSFFVHSLVHVGKCHLKIGNYSESLKYLLQSVEIQKQTTQFYNHNNYLAITLDYVETCYSYLRDTKIALNYSLESLELKKECRVKNNIIICESLKTVGFNYLKLREYRKFLKYYSEFINLKKQIKKGNRPNVADYQNHMNLFHNFCLKFQLGSLQMRNFKIIKIFLFLTLIVLVLSYILNCIF